jgi:hypothetical protein
MATLTAYFTKDTFLRSVNPTTNYGSSLYIEGANIVGILHNVIVWADLSSIPAGSVINSASLNLEAAGIYNGSYNLYPILAANNGWTELGATWNTINGAGAWAGGASGCGTSGADYSATPLAINYTPAMIPVPNVVTLNVTEFAKMISGGAIGNNGIVIKATGTNNDNSWHSKEQTGHGGYIYVDYTPPSLTVTNCVPNVGPTAGGTAVTLTGTNFVAPATVTFGGTAATGITVVNPTTITCTTPAHTAGWVDVFVSCATGSDTLEDGFAYYASYSPGVGSWLKSTRPTKYATGLLGKTLAPIYVVTFADVATRYSSGRVLNPTTHLGSTTIRPLLKNPGSVSSEITIAEGKTSISSFEFELLDRDLEITKTMFLKTIPNQRVTVQLGFEDQQHQEFATIFVGKVLDYELGEEGKTWKFELVDLYHDADSFAMDAITTLNTSVNDAVTSVIGVSMTDFALATGTGSIKSYIKIEDEIISYTGNAANTFTGCVRGRLGTVASDHDAGSPITNYIVIEDNVIDIMLKILTSTGAGTNGVYDVYLASQGLGIPVADIDLVSFTQMQAWWFNGYTFHFEFGEKINAKEFFEDEILKYICAYIYVNNSGKIAFKFNSPPLATIDMPEINDDNIVGQPRWTGQMLAGYFYNEIDIQYDYHAGTDEFLTRAFFEDSDSQTKYQRVNTVSWESRGIQTSLLGTIRVNRLMKRFLNRFKNPSPVIEVNVFWGNRDLQIGTVVKFSSSKIPDVSRGVQGVTNVLMEIVSAQSDSIEGITRLTLVNTGYSYGKRYMIIAPSTAAPISFPNYESATERQKIYWFIGRKINDSLNVMNDATEGYYLC